MVVAEPRRWRGRLTEEVGEGRGGREGATVVPLRMEEDEEEGEEEESRRRRRGRKGTEPLAGMYERSQTKPRRNRTEEMRGPL